MKELREKSKHLDKVSFIAWKFFQFDPVQNFNKGLESCHLIHQTLANDKNLGQSKIEVFADGSIKCDSKIEICFGKSNKHSGKRGKCWLPGIQGPLPQGCKLSELFVRVTTAITKGD